MNVFLIILLTILVTAIASVDFHPNRNKAAIKALGTTSRRAKAMAKFIDIYPGFHLFINLLSLLAVIWIACLAALTWHMLAGCFIALVVIALAQLLGARLISLTDQLIIQHAEFLVRYMSWTGALNTLVPDRYTADPVEDVEELINVLHASHIDCPTQMVIEKALHLQHLTIDKLIRTKWADMVKVSYKDKLTPKRIDELFQNQQKIFPVVRNDENDVVGLLHFADISTVGQTEKDLIASTKRNFVTCEASTSVSEALKLMADDETTVVVVVNKNHKVLGLVNLADIIATEPVCAH